MKRTGPLPTPTPILKMRGSWRGGERPDEPKLPVTVPKYPRWMNKDKLAKYKWSQMAPLLEAMGVLTLADEDALARYCQMYSIHRKLSEQIREEGTIEPAVGKHGQIVGTKTKPIMNQMMKISEQMLKLAEHFGLTPATRARLHPTGKDAKKKDKKKTDTFIKTGRAG